MPIPYRSPPLATLRTFEAVVRNLLFTRTASELGLTRRRPLFMVNANPFDGGVSQGVGQRIELVADQSKNLLDADALKHTDQRSRDLFAPCIPPMWLHG